MDIVVSILKMLGGLVLLIYGMKILSSNLKKLSGGKLEKILLNVTNNVFKALLVGFLITVVTHSSAATTVIVVGLVGANILTLKNAIPIIMGANIGTTMNSQILRLANISSNSLLSLLTPECFAPILLIVGLLILEKGKKQKTKDIGSLIMGLGLIFTGMMTMMNVASTFSELPILTTILQKLSNPLLGVIAGAIVTAIVQSSSATIGILQALSTTGLITYNTIIPIVLGQNIGTCVTSIFASIGGNINSKRVAAVHLYFNLIGTIIFLIGIYSYQSFIGFSFWQDAVDMGRIADFHTIFNVVSTLVLLPFLNQLEKLTILTVRESKKNKDEDLEESNHLVVLNTLDDKFKTIPTIAISNSSKVISTMSDLSLKNFLRSIKLVEKYDYKLLDKIQNCEDNIDKMEEEVTKYLVGLENLDLTIEDNEIISSLLNIESEFEKVGDYSYRLAKTLENMNEKDLDFSKIAKQELKIMFDITEETIIKTQKLYKTKNIKKGIDIEALKEFYGLKKEEIKAIHINRLKRGSCNVESGIAFLEILNICESIIKHCENVSEISLIYTKKTDNNENEFKVNNLTDKFKNEISTRLKSYKKKYNFNY